MRRQSRCQSVAGSCYATAPRCVGSTRRRAFITEGAMSCLAQTGERPGFARRLAHWWRNWNGRRRAMAELDRCGSAEVERIARDVGVSGADFSILAGKWPDAADRLYWRMNEIKLDRAEVTHADPQVMRDLQRVCTVCGSKRRCE